MDRKAIQRILDYIEDNLKAEISVEELSDLAGFSLFHFYRLFQSAVGMPVMQYITRRRILHGIHEISLGHKKIDVALSYGYETYAGFYKSFVREIGYTPKVYLKMYKAKKPYRINILQEEHIIMSQKKIRDILINWELENEKIADVVYGETGEISDSAKYVGEDYVIKFSANLGSIKKTIDISHALESIGLLAAQTIPTKDGKYYVEDAGLYYVLSKRIQGENIKVGSVYLDEYLEKARFIGEIVGQLSLALAKIDVVVDDMNILKNVCEWAIPALNEKVVIDKSFLESYQRRFRELYDELPKQIIHRDPNPSNIITNDDKWGFIDFDLSECSVRIYDPCYAASAILSESFELDNPDKLKKWIEIFREIMYGYDAVAKLTESEKEAIPYVLLANQFIATSWFADKDKYKDIYEVNVSMTEWMIDHFENLKI